MEWIIILVIVAAYYDLSMQIKKILKIQDVAKKKFPSLKNLINKNIEIELNDYYIEKDKRGILIKYDDTWIALETKDKNGNIKQNYFRLLDIVSINILDK